MELTTLDILCTWDHAVFFDLKFMLLIKLDPNFFPFLVNLPVSGLQEIKNIRQCPRGTQMQLSSVECLQSETNSIFKGYFPV
jgi:hypothetical protein